MTVAATFADYDYSNSHWNIYSYVVREKRLTPMSLARSNNTWRYGSEWQTTRPETVFRNASDKCAVDLQKWFLLKLIYRPGVPNSLEWMVLVFFSPFNFRRLPAS